MLKLKAKRSAPLSPKDLMFEVLSDLSSINFKYLFDCNLSYCYFGDDVICRITQNKKEGPIKERLDRYLNHYIKWGLSFDNIAFSNHK